MSGLGLRETVVKGETGNLVQQKGKEKRKESCIQPDFKFSNISHNQEEDIEISSSPDNKDASDVVEQVFSSFDPGLGTFPMTDAHQSWHSLKRSKTQQLNNSDEYYSKDEDYRHSFLIFISQEN
ncbi:hypothetical protein TNCV_4586941 [Trichonephila clavipes]|nr:hypothetical protein TNCV_4586941 [Trichonephila clavipes]